ncbi:MAG: hypothetical protein AAGB26_10555 [Planctomycetota bacterium]
MSFDITFISSRHSGRTQEVRNPFTGEIQLGKVSDPLSDDERTAVQQVLRGYGLTEVDEHGFGHVELAGGHSLEVIFEHLFSPDFTSAGAFLRGLSEDIAAFIFEIAEAGRFVIVDQKGRAMVTSSVPRESIAEIYPDAEVVRSGADIMAALQAGFDEWSGYRDAIVDGDL